MILFISSFYKISHILINYLVYVYLFKLCLSLNQRQYHMNSVQESYFRLEPTLNENILF